MERIQQRIYLSRKSLNSIEFEHDVLKIPLNVGEETSFEIIIINHGKPTHVHFSLGEQMKDKVMILRDKVYVIDKEKIAAIVRLPKSYAGVVAELDVGEIFVSAGYGAAKKSFPVAIIEAKEERKEEHELEAATLKEKKVTKVSSEEKVLLQRLGVSAVAAILFFIFFVLVFYFPPASFICALIASLLFIFIVIYNF
ncbi:MAG: hypothetical protein U9N61_04555 [Euryarchaeota archaeon]|nr:hypothetical protein [Euryarchaeota archaeon]